MARPSDYTQEIAEKICGLIEEGKSLVTICNAVDMPSRVTVHAWLDKHPEFLNRYTRAREIQADYLVEEMLAIADETTNDKIIDEEGNERPNTEVIARSRLRVDTRKFIAAKLRPKKWGESIRTEATIDMRVTNATDLTDDQLAAIATASSK